MEYLPILNFNIIEQNITLGHGWPLFIFFKLPFVRSTTLTYRTSSDAVIKRTEDVQKGDAKPKL